MLFDADKFAEWSGGFWEPLTPDSIMGVSNNTRTLNKGDLYVAIKGEKFDGHEFVLGAFEKGASGALVDRTASVKGIEGKPLLRVDNTIDALGKIAAGYRQQIDPEIIGVTGSVGKSTVKEILASVLSTVMPTAKTWGNYNNDIGLPLSLLAMAEDAKAGVFEVGMNHSGEIASLCKILRPKWGIVTAIGSVHIKFFNSVEDIALEKGALLKSLPSDGHAILCCDDEYYEILKSRVNCNLHTVSMGNDADYVVNYKSGVNQLSVYETKSSENLNCKWVWSGKHNALNAGYAIAVARVMGMGWHDIKKGLHNYRPLAMRWDVETINGVKVINDAYNANPLSMRAALQTFAENDTCENKWLVLGAMRELGQSSDTEHYSLGEYVAEGDWSGVVLMGETGQTIAAGMKKRGFDNTRIICCESNSEAVDILFRELSDGDEVLLKASRSVALENVVEGLENKYEEASC